MATSRARAWITSDVSPVHPEARMKVKGHPVLSTKALDVVTRFGSAIRRTDRQVSATRDHGESGRRREVIF
jgi:hypothetical protein